MTRILGIFAVICFLSISPAFAQEDADAVLAEQGITGEEAAKLADETAETAPKPALPKDKYEERLELARKMHEIWPVRPRVEDALDAVAEQVPAGERLKFKASMRKAIKFQALEEASIDAMADIFTVKELEAMIAFYGSKEGRSVSHKTSDYERALQPEMIKMIDKALLDAKLGTQ